MSIGFVTFSVKNVKYIFDMYRLGRCVFGPYTFEKENDFLSDLKSWKSIEYRIQRNVTLGNEITIALTRCALYYFVKRHVFKFDKISTKNWCTQWLIIASSYALFLWNYSAAHNVLKRFGWSSFCCCCFSYFRYDESWLYSFVITTIRTLTMNFDHENQNEETEPLLILNHLLTIQELRGHCHTMHDDFRRKKINFFHDIWTWD